MSTANKALTPHTAATNASAFIPHGALLQQMYGHWATNTTIPYVFNNGARWPVLLISAWAHYKGKPFLVDMQTCTYKLQQTDKLSTINMESIKPDFISEWLFMTNMSDIIWGSFDAQI